jgi:DNA-binding response OmpR family regulator
MPPERILVVEDDDVIGRSLERTLLGQGYDVAWARTVAEAKDALTPATALVLLDLGLPDGDGLALCAELRRRMAGLDIILLTARQTEADVVLGLDAGADDYLVKPFRLAELLARIRARLRRQPSDDVLHAGPLDLDVAARRARVNGVTVDLRPKEFDLLALLAANAGNVVGRERIMAEVWDEHWFGSTKTLDIHIATLRRKLAAQGGPGAIGTLRGIGYRLEWT